MIKAKYLKISAEVRYWEDATVNDQEDEDGTLIPFREKDLWEPTIDLETGFILCKWLCFALTTGCIFHFLLAKS